MLQAEAVFYRVQAIGSGSCCRRRSHLSLRHCPNKFDNLSRLSSKFLSFVRLRLMLGSVAL